MNDWISSGCKLAGTIFITFIIRKLDFACQLSRPSKKAFPFALRVSSDQQGDYDHPAAVIKTGQKDLKAQPIDLRLRPTEEATTSLDKQWCTDIVWTLAQKIDANGL